MARRVKHSVEFYKTAVRGAVDSKGNRFMGLRSAARGFSASEGFDLRKASSLTPAQKGKITRYWHELQELTAQHKKVYRPRNAEHLQEAQILGGHSKGFKFKVAFLPASDDAEIVHTAQGMQIRERTFRKMLIDFNMRRLATDPKAEIARTMDRAPGATRFQIQAGTNLIGQVGDRVTTSRLIEQLMLKYDGRTALPEGSGNRGDNPKHHKYTKWLHGLVAYDIQGLPRDTVLKYLAEGERANRKLRKARRALRKRVR